MKTTVTVFLLASVKAATKMSWSEEVTSIITAPGRIYSAIGSCAGLCGPQGRLLMVLNAHSFSKQLQQFRNCIELFTRQRHNGSSLTRIFHSASEICGGG
jgi:hypothetical protein